MALTDILTAASDEHLKDRIAAAAATLGIASTRSWAEMNAELITAHTIEGVGQRIADVYTYGVAQVKQQTVIPAPAGADPQYVTDAQILEAVEAVHKSQNTQSRRPDGNAI